MDQSSFSCSSITLLKFIFLAIILFASSIYSIFYWSSISLILFLLSWTFSAKDFIYSTSSLLLSSFMFNILISLLKFELVLTKDPRLLSNSELDSRKAFFILTSSIIYTKFSTFPSLSSIYLVNWNTNTFK